MTSPGLSVPRQVGNFGRHFLEMCVAMCVGVGLANLLLVAIRAAGLPDPRADWPFVALIGIAVLITVPMVAWMRFRGMPGRPIAEMTLAGIAAVPIAAALGAISPTDFAVGELCGIECVAMLVAMVVRLDLYTGRTGHHMAHGPAIS